ncbi:TadE/TadG family type IV pilus assembly protein [Paraburkholderia sediminicola]|uniref:TadE/TadG family type IV pilus assembly protein n=2 Tax=Paraburkholderia sediminicola TaxID=458836 RepID=UPI0038BA55EE
MNARPQPRVTMRAASPTPPAPSRVMRTPSRQRGLTTLEFVIALPIVLFLLIGTLEMGLILMADASLEIAVRQASRYGETTMVPTGETRDEAVTKLIDNDLFAWVKSPQQIIITTTTYPSYASGAKTANGMGGLGDIVLYNVSFTRPTFTGILGLAGVTQLTFTRSILIQNEP